MALRGRGGFGNYYHSTTTPVAQKTPVPVQHVSSPTYKFHTGRGGFGNTIAAHQIPANSTDEYVNEAIKAEAEPRRFMIGRGGAGNHIGDGPKARSDSVSSSDSSDSTTGNMTPFVSQPGLSLAPATSRLWQRIKPSWTR